MMSEDGARASIPWEQVVAGAAALSAAARVADMAARFLVLVDSWASPSAVLCARRDPESATGARMVPELTSGAVTATAERALAKLFTDYPPGTLTRPTLVRPTEESSAFKVRDTLVVPWAHGPALAGFLVLRGLPRPQPPNLGDAVALLAAPLWARVAEGLAGPEAQAAEATGAARLSELRRLVDALEADLRSRPVAPAADIEAAVAEARQQVESEREAARVEAGELKARLEASQAQIETLQSQGESLRGKLEAEGARTAESLARASEAEAARDAALVRAEAAEKAATEAAARSDELAEARLARERAESERDAATARAEAAEKRAAEGEARTEEGEESRRALEQALGERDAARAEAAELRGRLEAEGTRTAESLARASEAEAARDAALMRAEAAEKAATEAGARSDELAEARLARERAESERDAAVARLAAADQRAAEGEARTEEGEESRRALEQALGERDAARAEAAELRGRLEALQGQVETLQGQGESLRGKLENEGARAAELLARASEAEKACDAALARAEVADREREAAGAALAAAEERSRKAESEAHAASDRPDGSLSALRSAVEALRRTPFVPPTVRVLFSEADGLLQTGPHRGERLGRLLILDRDAPILSGLAAELEQEGVDVLIAHYADEVSLFLKTPDARDLTALVLDVLALRPDQNVVELVRGWRRDLPSLAIFLTFRADNPTEAERAQRLPSSTTAGYIPRPLAKAPLIEAVSSLARRATKR